MDEKKAEKLDKKIIWEPINYFRIKSNIHCPATAGWEGKIRG